MRGCVSGLLCLQDSGSQSPSELGLWHAANLGIVPWEFGVSCEILPVRLGTDAAGYHRE